MTQIPRRTGRALAVALIGAAGWAGALAVFIAIARSSWALSSPLIAADPADVLLLIVAVLGALVTAWLGLATVASALGELPGTIGWFCSRLSDRIAPAVLRRIVTVAIGTALVAGAMVLGLAGWAIAVPRHRSIAGGVVLGIDMTYVLIAAVAAIALVILAGMCMAGLQ